MTVRQVSRVGDLSSGSFFLEPRPLVRGSHNVLVNGRPCGRMGDNLLIKGVVISSSKVLVNGKPIAHVGTPTSMISEYMLQGSSNVVTGG